MASNTTLPFQGEWSVSDLKQTLAAGGVLAIATESSYGLAADPCNARGVAAIYRLKGRADALALPVVAASGAQIQRLGAVIAGQVTERLARLWPAPLSLVLPLAKPIPASAGLSSVAVRIPSDERLRRLLEELDLPLTATSANASGCQPATTIDELQEFLKDSEVVVVDGRTCPGGPPSTLVQVVDSTIRVLREGRFPIDHLARIAQQTGCRLELSASAAEKSVEGSCQRASLRS